MKIHLSSSTATSIADLKVVELCLEGLDRAVSQLEVLVQAIALRDQLRPDASAFHPHMGWVTHVLFPLPEASLLRLDLLGEPPAELLLLLLELGVVELLHLALAILARLHLLLAVILVVTLLSSRDKVEHECADEQRAQLAEVTVILVLHCTSVNITCGKQNIGKYTPSATPHRYSRPFTTRPSRVWTSSVEPIIEKGMASARMRACSALASSSASTGG